MVKSIKIPASAIALLKQAADEMSNNVCNDYSVEDTPENRKFITDMMAHMADDEEYDVSEHIYNGEIVTYDWMVLEYIAHLVAEANS